MVKVRERLWIPRLRRLVKRVIKDCHRCKRFHAIAYASPPPPANLPTAKTEGSTAYQIIGVDYAGSLRYRKSKGKEEKAYILLYACSLTRGVFLDLMPNMEMAECCTVFRDSSLEEVTSSVFTLIMGRRLQQLRSG